MMVGEEGGATARTPETPASAPGAPGPEGSAPAPGEAPAPPTEGSAPAPGEAPAPPIDPATQRSMRLLEIEKTMGQAARLSSVKSSAIRGRSIKVRVTDTSMEPTLRRADVLTIGPVTLMNLRPGDLVYFHVQEKYRVRRVVRRTALDNGMAFSVRSEAGDPEELVPAAQILGKVVSLERAGETIRLEKGTSGKGIRLDVDTVAERVIPYLQRLVDKAQELVARFRARKQKPEREEEK